MAAQLRARQVFNDAKLAHRLLESVLDPPRFRVYWAATCALLRTIGHVLKKVDHQLSEDHARAIDDAWQRWQAQREANAIFWEFIDAERNLVLKEYEIRADFGPHKIVVPEDGPAEDLHELGPEYYIAVSSGYFEGEDCRELARDALRWWDEELREIEIVSVD